MIPDEAGERAARGVREWAPVSSTPLLQKRSQLLVVALITFIAFALRLHLLREPLSYDESFSATLVASGFKQFLSTMWSGEGNMTLFYILLSGWKHLGYGEFSLRCLALLFGVATIPAVYQLGNRFLSSDAGLAGAALLALHGFHLYCSQFLRSYSLVVFLLVLSTYFFLSMVESPHKKPIWAAYVLTSALAVYAHLLAVLVLIPQWLSLTWGGLRRIGLIRSSAIVAAVGALASPMVADILLNNVGQLDWIPRPTIGRFLQVMQNLAGSYHGLWSSSRTVEGYVLLVPYAILWILAIFETIYFGSSESRVSAALRLLTFWFLFPIAALLAFSVFKPLSHPKSIFDPHYMSLCLPAAVLLAGQGMSILSGAAPRLRWVFPVALFFMLALSVDGIAVYYASRSLLSRQYDLRPVTHCILAQRKTGDVVFFYIPWKEPAPYFYYVRRELSSWSITGAPPAFSGNPAPETVALTTGPYKRIWLVWETGNPELIKQVPLIRSALEPHFHFVGERDFPGHGVALFAKGPQTQNKIP